MGRGASKLGSCCNSRGWKESDTTEWLALSLRVLALAGFLGFVKRIWVSWWGPAARVTFKHSSLSNTTHGSWGDLLLTLRFLEAWRGSLGGSCSSEVFYFSGEISDLEMSWWYSGLPKAWERCLRGSYALEQIPSSGVLSESEETSCLSLGLPRTGRAPFT